MRPDLTYLNAQFKKYNDLCYGGRLPHPAIKLNSRIRSLGLTCCRYNRLTRTRTIWIEISIRLDLPEEEYIDTLLHEMIHYYIMVNQLKDTSTHGALFKAEMNRLKQEYGLHVSLKFNNPELVEAQIKRAQRVFCILEDFFGNCYISVIAKSRLFEFWNYPSLLNRIRIKKSGWYISDNKLVYRYPRCTDFKIYKIEPTQKEELLSVSKPLIRDGEVIRIGRKP